MSEELVRLEYHTHTIFSKDCLTELDDFISVCRKKKIDKVVITDHNTIEGAVLAQKIAPDLVIIGEEIRTTAGELLAAFVQETIPAYLSAEKSIELLRDQGAFISVSHPFDRRGGGWNIDHLKEIGEMVDAVEIYNSRCIPQSYNSQAAAFAKKNNIPGTVGSDAHTLFELGRSTMFLPKFESADELRAVIGRGIPTLKPSGVGVRLASRYADLYKKVFYR